MTNSTFNNKRIARNSIYMAIRMVFVLGLTLYTTRIILRILGVEDYGVYNVVCGFVSMFAFLNTSMSNGIQRFFNYELGKHGENGANKVYNTALLIQCILAVVIIVLTESFGLWYLHNKMVIPADRMFAAEWIFQLSILSFLFLIMQAPYTAAVMAHERMDFYAIISVLDAILKLVIVIAIPLFSGDKLIVYGILFAFISVLNFCLYYIYCKRNFKEIRMCFNIENKTLRSMLSFSCWNLFGSLSGVMKEQGINLVLNFFFGPIVNAARGVAHQVNGGLQSFVSNLTIPVRPQVVQSYAQGQVVRTIHLTHSISKLSCYCLYIVAMPVLVEIDYVLKVWLGNNIPEHTSMFIFIVVLTSFWSNLNSAVSGVVHASGKMKWYQIIGGSLGILSVPLAYAVLSFGGSPESALWVVFGMMATIQVASLVILKSIIDYSIIDYIKVVILPIIAVIATSVWFPLIPHLIFPEGIVRFIAVCIVSILVISIDIFFIGLNKSERNLVRQIVSRRNKKNYE